MVKHILFAPPSNKSEPERANRIMTYCGIDLVNVLNHFDKGVFTDTRQAAARLPNFFAYFILTLNWWCGNAIKTTRYQGIVPAQFLPHHCPVLKNV